LLSTSAQSVSVEAKVPPPASSALLDISTQLVSVPPNAPAPSNAFPLRSVKPPSIVLRVSSSSPSVAQRTMSLPSMIVSSGPSTLVIAMALLAVAIGP